MAYASVHVKTLLWGTGGGCRSIISRKGEAMDAVVFRGVTHPTPLEVSAKYYNMVREACCETVEGPTRLGVILFWLREIASYVDRLFICGDVEF